MNITIRYRLYPNLKEKNFERKKIIIFQTNIRAEEKLFSVFFKSSIPLFSPPRYTPLLL